MACGSQLRSRPHVSVFVNLLSRGWSIERRLSPPPPDGRRDRRLSLLLVPTLSLGPSGLNSAAAAVDSTPPHATTLRPSSPVTPSNPHPFLPPPWSHGGQLQQQTESLSAGCGGLWSNSWGLFFLPGRSLEARTSSSPVSSNSSSPHIPTSSSSNSFSTTYSFTSDLSTPSLPCSLLFFHVLPLSVHHSSPPTPSPPPTLPPPISPLIAPPPLSPSFLPPYFSSFIFFIILRLFLFLLHLPLVLSGFPQISWSLVQNHSFLYSTTLSSSSPHLSADSIRLCCDF